MIRNPKSFEVWSACSPYVHYVITQLEMLPMTEYNILIDNSTSIH